MPNLIQITALIFTLVLGFFIGKSCQDNVSAPEPREAETVHKPTNDSQLRDELEKARETIDELRRSHDEIAAQMAPTTRAGSTTPSNSPSANPESTSKSTLIEALERSPEPPVPGSTLEDAAIIQEANAYVQSAEFKSVGKTEKSTNPAERVSNSRKFLNGVSIKNMNKVESSLSPYKNPDANLRALYGEWTGSITFSDKKRKKGRMSLTLQEPTDTPYQPAIKVTMRPADRPRTTITGGVDQIKILAGATEAMFIESSDKSYLQLYFAPGEGSIIGNYYEKPQSGRYRRAGTVLLKRN